jgi:hypothetical protein
MVCKAIALTLLLLITMTTTIKATSQTTRSTSQQDSNHASAIRENSPPAGTYWAKTYGGSSTDGAYSVQQTADGGYIVAGYTDSFGAGSYDYWVLKLSSTGSVMWQKTYGGEYDDYAYSVEQTSDGGYIVAGYTASFGAGGDRLCVLKLNSTGGVTWLKAYGGSSYDYGYSVQQTSDGGYMVAGDTNSFGAGSSDAWVVKLGASGDIVWDGGSGVSTAIISLTPLDSSASVSTTSLTSADSAAAVQNTQVAARGSNARVTAQSGGGLAGQEIQLIMIGGLAAVAVVGLVLVALVVMERKKSPIGIRLEHSIEFS